MQFAQALHLCYFDRALAPLRAVSSCARTELNPRWSLARAFYGVFLAGDYRLAGGPESQAAASIELDPLSPFIHGAAGMTAFAGGDVPGAERAARRALELQPDFLMGAWLLAIALDHQGRLEEAEAMIEPDDGDVARADLRGDDRQDLRAPAAPRRLRPASRPSSRIGAMRGEYIPRACDVIIAIGRDDIPGLRRALRACLDEETSWLTVRMGPGPGLENFRADPEIDALLNQLYDGADPDRS